MTEALAYLTAPRYHENEARVELLKAKQAAQISYIEDLKSQKPQLEIGKTWSGVADAQIQTGLDAAWSSTRQVQPYIKDKDAPIPGLFVLGLGKLGGYDLNYSSDVDVVAFYDNARTPIPQAAGRTDLCSRVLRSFNALIDGHKSGPFAWRVDWRLRPDPSVTDLAMSAEAGLDYFFFHAAPWRRLAMLKARVVAGDRGAGETFMKDLHPFIWRRSLDFSMIEQIAHLKNRIHLEHPDLADARRVSDDLAVQDGFHLKLGRGGIRDIEFIVNAQQLLWGGREVSLQTTQTMDALDALKNLNLVTPERAEILAQAYGFFRGAENAVQAWGDQHIHKLPRETPIQDWVLECANVPTWAEFQTTVASYRSEVNEAFMALFSDIETSQSVQVEFAQVKGSDFGLSQEESAGLSDVITVVDTAIGNAQEPQAAKTRVLQWFHKLRAPVPYLRALQGRPELASLAMDSLITSPSIGNLVHQSPHVLDGLFQNQGLLNDYKVDQLIQQGSDLVAATSSYDAQLSALRSWINESLYATYLAMFAKTLSFGRGEIALTQLAEAALDLCAKVVATDLGFQKLPFTILAMGRLGMGAMAPASDLDLIFILDPDTDFDAGNRIVSRFKSAMNAPMREGRVYEIDTRLRPSGASGPPTLGLASFIEHQLERAKTWEHLALVPMRALKASFHGDEAVVPAVHNIQTRVLSRPRDRQQWLKDSQLMLRRLLEQRIGQDDVADTNVKLSAGGLMELEYLCAALAVRNPSDVSFQQAKDAANLSNVDRTLRRCLIAERLFGSNWPKLAPDLHSRFSPALASVKAARLRELGHLDSFPTLDDHSEGPVLWV